jgi:hypothetical protein
MLGCEKDATQPTPLMNNAQITVRKKIEFGELPMRQLLDFIGFRAFFIKPCNNSND